MLGVAAGRVEFVLKSDDALEGGAGVCGAAFASLLEPGEITSCFGELLEDEVS